ncbi:uncharacterized protein LOC116253342 [Nymphaea colorata]|nr:uncharacterized protein LOC116253342 [Nymphaea colorata]
MSKQSGEREDSSEIFRALFGNFSGDGSSSLFTNNPYKRKPDDQKPVPPETASLVAVSSGDDRKPKRAKLVVEGADVDGVGQDEEKKKKKKKRKRADDEGKSGLEANVESAVVEAGMEELKIGEGESSKKRRKKETESEKGKKRKRKEIEEEYERAKYGARVEKVGSEETIVKVGQKRKLESSEAMVVKTDDFDDEPKLRRTVFVGNLPLKMKKKSLVKEFSRFGEVESVRIRSVPILDSKLPRKSAIFKGQINDAMASVHAYIVFKDEESATSALSYNMAKIGENHIRVDRACPPRKKVKGENPSLYDHKRTIFVGNLPFDVKDEELYQLFCHLIQAESSIEAIRVIRDPHTSLGKGIAYVLFKSRDAANMVMKKKNECKLRDRVLRVCHSRPDSTPKKRENPEPVADSSYKKNKTMYSKKPLDEGQKPKAKAAAPSYQGLRASKVERSARKSGSSGFKHDLNLLNGEVGKEPKVRKSKRPAVAARKANSRKGFLPKRPKA